jgi:hypothetical protein
MSLLLSALAELFDVLKRKSLHALLVGVPLMVGMKFVSGAPASAMNSRSTPTMSGHSSATTGFSPLSVTNSALGVAGPSASRSSRMQPAGVCHPDSATSASSGELEGHRNPVHPRRPIAFNAAVEAGPDLPDHIVGLAANHCRRPDGARPWIAVTAEHGRRPAVAERARSALFPTTHRNHRRPAHPPRPGHHPDHSPDPQSENGMQTRTLDPRRPRLRTDPHPHANARQWSRHRNTASRLRIRHKPAIPHHRQIVGSRFSSG